MAAILRLANPDQAKAIPRKIKFTVTALEGVKTPPDGRVTVYDAKQPGLAFTVTANGARSFYVVRRIHGRPTRLRVGGADMTIEQARTSAAMMQGEIAGGSDPAEDRRQHRRAGTLGELWEKYRSEHVEARCSLKTLAGFKSLWETCLEQWQARGVMSIGESEVRSLHARLGVDRGHTTANRAIELLRSFYGWARIEPNPCRRGAVTMFKENSRTRFLSPDEMKRFLKAIESPAVNPDIADIVKLSLFTGARRANVQAARAEEFDLSAMTWRIPASKSKNGSEMVIPLVPQAAKIVKRRLGHDSGFLFPSTSTTGHVVEVKKTWKKILELAELAEVHFHDLRRSYASWMAGMGVSLPIIGRSLGHKHLAATQIYSRLDLDVVRAGAAGAVNAMLATAKPDRKGKRR